MMGYTASASGSKSDVLGQLRQQAASQAAALTSQNERDQLNASVTDVENALNNYAGDGDSVSASISGHISQSDPGSFAMQKSVGVTISRGALSGAAPVGGGAPAVGTPTPMPGSTGAPSNAAAVPAPGTPTPTPSPRI